MKKDIEEEQAEEAKVEEENKKLEEEYNMTLTEDNLTGSAVAQEESAEEAARRGARQITYTLKPSMTYVTYIAKKNAVRRWTKDGPDGENNGCLEVQIAVITEKIRAWVLIARETPKDHRLKHRLVRAVSNRRKLLDKLAWKDLPSYLKLRDELKIRHTYRMEALIGRLGEYKYTVENKPRAPGRKIINRMRKQKKLLQNRLARKLRQGKSTNEIFLMRKAMEQRQWRSRSFDDMNNLIAGKEPTEFVDPLNLP